MMPNITVPEPNGPVNICVVMAGAISGPIVVTAQTGQKAGAENQATGTITYWY